MTVLQEQGYRPAGVSPDGHAYRFTKQVGAAEARIDVTTDADDGAVVLDLLVPEGLGPRTDTTTVGSATAFPAPGISQALARTELVPVVVDDGVVSLVPRPSLLGAIVAKAVASVVDNQDRERHHRDLAFLCGLVDRPRALAHDTTPKDRQRLRRAAGVANPGAAWWRVDPDARVALEILAGD